MAMLKPRLGFLVVAAGEEAVWLKKPRASNVVC